MLLRLLFVTVLTCVSWVQSQNEILQNPGFESSLDGNWFCGGTCNLDRTNSDSYEGSWSGRVTQRQEDYAGVSQYVGLDSNNDYYFTAYVKLLNYNGGTMGHQVNCMAEMNYADGETVYSQVGRQPYTRLDRGWIKVGGDFYVANKALTSVRVYIQFQDTEVEYLVDAASLQLVPLTPNWEAEANQRIENIRKQNLNVVVTTGGSYDPANVEVEVFMHRHHFAFGSAIVADRISGTEDQDRAYQDVFYDNFEWAVFENAMKWRQMEWNQYEINFDRVENALTQLRNRDILVRGHCIMWDVDEFVADWLKPMNGDQVRVEMQRRMDYLLKRYEADILHWDVNNEQLHGTFFETKTGDWALMDWMFTEANQQVPNTKMMLNDFNVVSQAESTVALRNTAQELLNRGAPIHGIGVQSHFTGTINPHILSRRIDTVAEPGLPIWITELDIDGLSDKNALADSYETALRLFFSRPEVDGILIWGFWDQEHWRPAAALWEGPNFTPNAAGYRWMELVKGEWVSYLQLRPTSGDETFSSREFQGVYSVNIKYNGNTICHRSAAYDVPVGQDATWNIDVEAC